MKLVYRVLGMCYAYKPLLRWCDTRFLLAFIYELERLLNSKTSIVNQYCI